MLHIKLPTEGITAVSMHASVVVQSWHILTYHAQLQQICWPIPKVKHLWTIVCCVPRLLVWGGVAFNQLLVSATRGGAWGGVWLLFVIYQPCVASSSPYHPLLLNHWACCYKCTSVFVACNHGDCLGWQSPVSPAAPGGRGVGSGEEGECRVRGGGRSVGQERREECWVRERGRNVGSGEEGGV